MRLKKLGKRFTAFGLLAFLGFFALAQTLNPLSLLEGFFGSVLSGLQETMGASLPPPDPTLDACAREGYPTYLQVNQAGTTTSPFCPGQAEARARASGDWLVSVNRSPYGQEVASTVQVKSGKIANVEVVYRYNPPPPSPTATIYEFDPNTGRWFKIEDYYGPDPFDYWANNYDPLNTVYCTRSQSNCP